MVKGMKGREFVFLVLGIGLGIVIETLLFLSPFFEMTLWESICSYAKVISLATLIVTGVIGLALLLTALLFLGISITFIPGHP
jgi:hypothetical protein